MGQCLIRLVAAGIIAERNGSHTATVTHFDDLSDARCCSGISLPPRPWRARALQNGPPSPPMLSRDEINVPAAPQDFPQAAITATLTCCLDGLLIAYPG